MKLLLGFVYIFILNQNVILGNHVSDESEMKKVKNIIIFIGDGMGLAQVAASSYKLNGIDGKFEMEKFPITGLVKTHAADKLITDSASGATAMSTGYKTNVGMVGMTPDSLSKKTIFEAAIGKGIKTGLVVTSHITDATPSSFIAHVPQRSMQNEIAEQMVNSELTVILGGGKSRFIPEENKGSEREDNKNLILDAIDNGFDYVDSREALNESKSDRLLGLFAMNGFEFNEKEPTLAEMTEKAIEILSQNDDPFVLMVEGSQIDWRGHDNDFEGVVKQTKLFDDAIKVGRKFAENHTGTLVIVTADHETGGLTLTDEHEDGDLNSGISWSTGGHTAIPVPIFSYGQNAQEFTGVLDNTDIAKRISSILELNLDFGIPINCDNKKELVK